MTQSQSRLQANPEAAQRLGQAMNLGGGISLPFPAPTFWWTNGNPQMQVYAKQNPGLASLYHGGWTTKQTQIQELEKERNGIPDGLTEFDMSPRSNGGKSFPVYVTRKVTVAPISFRTRWEKENEGGGMITSLDYFPGGRQHMQMLSYLGFWKGKTLIPWGPVVLSVKGYQVAEVQNNVKTWKQALQPVLAKLGIPIPPNAFYMVLGTFGETPTSRMVGKGKNTNTITPVQLRMPEGEINEALLNTLYVGPDLLEQMAYYLEQADEWLAAWKQPGKNGQQGGVPGEPDGEVLIEDESSALADDIPF